MKRDELPPATPCPVCGASPEPTTVCRFCSSTKHGPAARMAIDQAFRRILRGEPHPWELAS